MRKVTREEWFSEGVRLFGDDIMQWEFVCPACKNVQKPADFEPYKDWGVSPSTATHNCVGRYDGHMHVEMGAGQPCNYTGYGLFNLCPVVVVDEGKDTRCFEFNCEGDDE